MNRFRYISITLMIVLAFVAAEALSSRASDAPEDFAALQKSLPGDTSLQGKVVYVDFWASWCVPCRQSFPWMRNMYDDYHSRGLEIIAINVDKDHKSALKFLEDNKINFPVVFDSTGDLARLYGLDAMPSSFIYGRDGKLASEHLGFRDDEAEGLENVILEQLTRKTEK